MSTNQPRRIVAPHPRRLDEVVGRNLPQWAVDFVVISLESDLRKGVYLTLKLAANHSSPHVRAMYDEVRRFFLRIDELMSLGDQVSLGCAYRMLTFPEPWEARLGYAGLGSYGTGVGEGELRDHLFKVLLANPELRRAIPTEPDALCLVPWIAMDRTSDVIITICKRHVIAFTQEQAAFWQFDNRCMQDRTVAGVWDRNTERLTAPSARVPVDDHGRTFLLVPKEICRSGPPMNPGQYLRDFDPKGPAGGSDGLTGKERLLRDAAANPGRLSEFAAERMKDAQRFQPRREFRPAKEGRRR